MLPHKMALGEITGKVAKTSSKCSANVIVGGKDMASKRCTFSQRNRRQADCYHVYFASFSFFVFFSHISLNANFKDFTALKLD